jgi:hypothetical protein
LPQRISKAAFKFRLLAQLAKAGDPINDGSLARPAEREVLELGVISLTAKPTEHSSRSKRCSSTR